MKPVGFLEEVDQGAGDQRQGGLDRVGRGGRGELDILLCQSSGGCELVSSEERRTPAQHIHRVLQLLIQI